MFQGLSLGLSPEARVGTLERAFPREGVRAAFATREKARPFWGFPGLDPQLPARSPFLSADCLCPLSLLQELDFPLFCALQPEQSVTLSLLQLSFSKFPLTYLGRGGGRYRG